MKFKRLLKENDCHNLYAFYSNRLSILSTRNIIVHFIPMHFSLKWWYNLLLLFPRTPKLYRYSCKIKESLFLFVTDPAAAEREAVHGLCEQHPRSWQAAARWLDSKLFRIDDLNFIWVGFFHQSMWFLFVFFAGLWRDQDLVRIQAHHNTLTPPGLCTVHVVLVFVIL